MFLRLTLSGCRKTCVLGVVTPCGGLRWLNECDGHRGIVEIVELRKGGKPHFKLVYKYRTRAHYALQIHKSKTGWIASLVRTELPTELEKSCESELFQYFVEEPLAFAAKIGDKEVGWVEVALHSFKDRARIWELLVLEEFQGKGIGTALIQRAEDGARRKGLRSVVLETQSCNVKAIDFYIARGYTLVGFDEQAYSNEDVEKGEIRLEFGKKLR